MPPSRGPTQLGMVALAIALAVGCRTRMAVPDGDVAASLTLPTTTDQMFDPAALRGRPAIVVFAWTTCPHCIDELPIAQRVADAESASLVVVFVRGNKAAAGALARELSLTAPVLIDDGTLRAKYDVRAVPYTLVLGPDGRAREAFAGTQDADTLRNAVVAAR